MPESEKEKMLRGELFRAFTPELTAERTRCRHACTRFNTAGEVSRRRLIELYKDILQDTTPLPPAKEDPAEDDAILEKEPWIEPPIRVDYGYNVKLGQGVFINYDCVIIDTRLVTIGARTLLGPKVSLYSGTHPLDPDLRNGTSGPESGKEIHIGEDSWLAGNVTVLPGVTIGDGAVIGAGSVVTKVRMLALDRLPVRVGESVLTDAPQDVPAYHLAVGNPARIVRKIERSGAR
ncbi:sugar O-acetyltransferase [Aspergillus foveolatus]|uniref:sugar O-acetyltransferase n=1 Tax=Aspergillus foveolatus TaxID=210207 RepID=UPI003CCD9F09